jgi:ABC-2 type transport system ATP-binding protein
MDLTLDRICKSFEKKVAVDELSLDVPEGCIYGIIGPNGAGKTTTIRMTMNITMPDSGEILIDGQPRPKDFNNRVGYLPEERGLYKGMKVIEVMTYMAMLKGCSKAAVLASADQWLERMKLIEYRNSKVEELSKGMQQKLQLITTLLHDPDLIILDEIFSGLDPLNIEIIKGILLDLKRAGKTILFSTHVMEQAEKLCDFICMINNGRKVLDGSMADVKSRFGRNTVQIDMEGDGAFVAGLPGVEDVREFNNYLELRLADGADSNAIMKAVVDKVQVRRFEIVGPSLYDIFIQTAQIDPKNFDKGEGSPNA